ncbi:muscle M-line assembly protein unc-89-like [Lytechinus pictus]|uniref:muscle M-line assembly protein unc-89-like n=1 Tax=Lytechinus pictus TaxID=7653 RepID=UPI0030B9F511
MERVVNARVFEETLTKEQLDDMIKKNIRPDHWEDGIASYFRVQKIIDLLEDERLPLDPHLDTAISVLSDGKAKIRNQSHKKFCRDIRAKVDDLENQTDDELSQPVECLVPGCFPIGPECESLGIYGDVLCDEEKQFPKPISPSRVTNRLMFELSEYVTRIKETYQNVAGWIKKIMGWGDECALPATLVEEWCTTLTRETIRKKNRSLFVAQKYLLEKFEFPGLVVPSKNKNNEGVDTPTAGLFNGGEIDGKSDMGNKANIEDGYSGNHAENDNEENDIEDHDNKENGSEENMDISGDLQEGTEVKKTPSKKLLVTSSSSGNGDGEKKEIPADSGGVDEDMEDGGDTQNDEDNGSTKDTGSNEEESDETSPPPRQTSSRSAAKAAIGKIVKPEPKRPSRQATQAAGAASSQKPTRQSAPSRSTRSRAPIKKTPPKVQRSSVRSSRKRKLESSDDASNPDEDDDDDEDVNEDDYEDEEEDDDDEDDESSIEEGEVKTPRSRSTRSKSQRSESAKTIMIKKDIAEATKLFTSISKVVHTIKKELKIALDYLESETDKINKNLQKAEKVLDKVIKSVKYEKIQDDIKDDDDEEEDNSGQEEESEEEMPVRKTRNSPKTKKITVQVKQGVKDKLKKSQVKVERLNAKKVPPSNAARNTSRKESTPIPKVSRPKRGSTSPRPVLSKDSPKKPLGEIKDFDKEKLFSSRLSVSLTKISEVLVKRALESEPCYEESEIEISPPRQSHSSENSDEDKDADDELDDDHDDEEKVEDDKISKVIRRKSGRFGSTKIVPRRSADLRSGKNEPSKKVTSESPKNSGNLDGDDSVTSKTSRRSPRGRRDDIVKEINNTEEVLSDGEKKRTTRSTRSGKTKEDLPKRVEGSYRSLRERRESPTTDEEVNKPSTMDSPYSGSDDDDDDSIPKKSQHTAFATLAAGMTSFGDLRKTTPKEKVKKRSLNDFVKKLNSPKRRKTDSESESSARSKGVKQQPDDSEEDGTEVNEEDDDFLEKRAEKEIEKPNSKGSAELAEKSADEQQTVDEKMDDTTEEQPEDVDPQTTEVAEHTENPEEVNDEAAQMEKEVDKDDDFPGDAIIGRHIRHRCSLGKHGLYKWYEGKVVHKSTASELLKLDEEQFGHLNNLYTFYTVKYNDNDEIQAKALEYDWDRENLKIML